jgi:TolB-like protein/Tfp pilus assembly protein PilF
LSRNPAPPQQVNPAIPPRLGQIILKALEKDPAQRYQSASDLRADLKSVKRELESGISSPLAEPSTIPSVQSDPSSSRLLPLADPSRTATKPRRPFVPAAAAIVLILAAAWAFYSYRARAIESIAVLPFANTNSDSSTEYLGDGIAQSLIDNLSRLPQLRVMASGTTFTYKGRQVDPRKVGQDLKVDAVLQGRVLKVGNTLRVETDLVKTSDGTQLWGEQYQRGMADVLSLEADISEEIADKLKLRLSGRQQQELTKQYTANSEAHQLYLEGMYQTKTYSKDGLEKGSEYFRQAIALDPNYALAYEGLAYNLSIAEDWFVFPRDVMPQAEEAAKKAIQLDNKLGEAHTILGDVYFFYDYSLPAAESEFQRAIVLSPNSAEPHNLYGWFLVSQKRFDDGIAENQQARKLDPLSSEVNFLLGQSLYLSRRYDQALSQLRATTALDPGYWVAHDMLGWVYEQRGDYPHAIAEFEKARSLEPNVAEPLASLGRAYALSGQPAKAHQVLDQLRDLSGKIHVIPYNLAAIYAALGDQDSALAELDKAYQERSWYLLWLGVDPQLDSLRADPRFTALLHRVGIPQ